MISLEALNVLPERQFAAALAGMSERSPPPRSAAKFSQRVFYGALSGAEAL